MLGNYFIKLAFGTLPFELHPDNLFIPNIEFFYLEPSMGRRRSIISLNIYFQSVVKWLSDTANLALTISFITLGINLYNFCKRIKEEKTNLSIELYNYIPIQRELAAAVDLSFVNNSKLPITITGLEIFITNDRGKSISKRCFGTKELIGKFDDENGTSKIFSSIFPIDIPPLGSARGIFKFSKLSFQPIAIPYMDSKVTIYTNRKELEFSLPIKRVSKEREQLGLKQYS